MKLRLGLVCALTAGLFGCSTTPTQELPKVNHVDIDRYMGDWYVIAHIPIFVEKNAYDAVETYTLKEDGKEVQVHYEFHEGGHDKELKTYKSKGFISDDPALWQIQFIWPFKADYQISYLSEDYSTVIVARPSRDYVWLMSRNPQMDDATYESMKTKIEEMGYDMTQLRRVPHLDKE